jgi:4-amino-4-deoxy-L-arabinose transferase-like glycosyltransferase
VSLLFAIFQVTVTALAAWTTGAWLFRRLWPLRHPALRTAVYIAVGLLVWSHILFGLVLLHLVSKASLAWLFGLFCALALAGLLPKLLGRNRESLTAIRARLDAWTILFGLAAGLYVAWLIASAALPPTAIDELLYHLEVPRRFLEAGGQVLFRDNSFGYSPQFGEMLFMFALPFGGESAARLFHALFAVLLALAVYGFVRQHAARYYATTASAVVLSVPTLMVVGAWAYVDLMFALFAFLALIGLIQFLTTDEKKWIALAAVMTGGACAVKYTGLQLLLLLLLLLLVELLRGRVNWRLAPLALVLALVIPSVYYLRSLALTGWPLFPFRLPFFTLSPEINWDPDRAKLLLFFLNSFGAPSHTLTSRILAPLLVFIHGRFADYRAYDGVAGPVFLLAPFLWLGRRAKPSADAGAPEEGATPTGGAPLENAPDRVTVRMLICFAVAFLAYWTITTQQVRFLLPGLCALAAILAFGLARRRSRLPHVLVWALVALNLTLGVREVLRLRPFGYWMGTESREDFLAGRVPLYRMYQAMNRLVPPGEVYLVDSSNHLYYLTCRARSDYVFEHYSLLNALERSSSPEDMLAFFRSQRVTHLMLNGYILTHPALGLPANDLRKLDVFVRRYTRVVHTYGKLYLFRIEAP